MIQINDIQALDRHPELSLLMQAQIQLLLYRPLRVSVIERAEEYEAIRAAVEAFAAHSCLLGHIGMTEDLEDYVLFPWHFGARDATVFYIPAAYVKHLR